jgi:uncharacterized protein YxjI
MKFPLSLSFKIIAIASQIYIRDADGDLIGYVRQKLFKLKEDINIFADENQSRLLYNIKADRVLDFSPRFNFTDSRGLSLGSVKRRGMRSLWRADYEIADASGAEVMQIREENGWVKVVDALIGELPVVGMFTGYFLHPSYIVSRTGGTPVARVAKTPAMFEGKFRLEQLGPMSEEEEQCVFLSVLTMVLMERSRG